MSQINELIAELCPNGVEWKTLGEVCEIVRGASPRPIGAYLTTAVGGIPWIKIGDVNPDSRYIESTEEKITAEGAAHSRLLHKGDFVLSNSMSFGRPYILKIDGCIHDGWVSISKFDEFLTSDYLFYILKSDVVQKHWKQKAGKGSVANLNADIIKATQIPLPPLEIQSRIVEILNNFTNLTANLTSELALRRKQFEHYLDVFFGENEDTMESLAKEKNIEIKALQDLGTLTRGRRFVRDDIRTEGVPCIHYGDMYTTYGIAEQNTITFLDEEKANKLRFAEPNDVVIVGAGENDWDIGVGLAWFGKQNVVVHDACYIYKHNLNPKFVSYYLRSNNYHLQIRKWVSSGKISAISDKNLGKAKIPFYAKEAQQSIVEKLDKFTALIENIEKELDLRQKQYEYYREQLLTYLNS